MTQDRMNAKQVSPSRTNVVKPVEKRKPAPAKGKEARISPFPKVFDAQQVQKMRPQQIRHMLVRISSLFVILIPTILASIYYGFIASDQYAVEVRFSVRGVSGIVSADLLGMFSGAASSGSTMADSYILMDYLVSRPMIEKLNERVDLEKVYGSHNADFLSSFDTSKPIEKFVEYWQKMVSITFDSTSQIIVLKVRAFTPQDAKAIAQTILDLSEEMVNDLSMQEREDAVKQAEHEVEKKETKLREVRHKVRNFRDREQMIDPSKTAEARLTVQAELEQKLTMAKTEFNLKRQFLDNDAPSLRVLDSKIKALEKQVSQERANISNYQSENETEIGPLTGLIQDYRDLLMDQEFAEKAYVAAQRAFETAQLEANRRERYLVTFIRPSEPQMALYPKRVMRTLLVLVLSMIIWAIGVLVVYSVRDHAT